MSVMAIWTKLLARRTLPRVRGSAVVEGLKKEVSWVTEKGGPCDGALVDRKLRFIANKGRAS
jgi:hypothetical protein